MAMERGTCESLFLYRVARGKETTLRFWFREESLDHLSGVVER
jgi:hypothetical protein